MTDTKSKCKLVFLLSILALPIRVGLSSELVITVPPESATVPIYTPGTFTCEGNGDELKWIIQNAHLTPAIQQQRGITYTDPGIGPGNLSSVLTVAGLPVNDGLLISCQIISHSPLNVVSSGATLTIRGISLVEDIKISFTSNNSLLITWSPPVYQSAVGSPITYRVFVMDDEDGEMLLDTNTTGTNITVANITQCDTFNISVIAQVDQYTSNDNTERNNGNYSIAGYDTQPLIPSISFELGCPPSKCLVSLMDGNTEVTDIINETKHIIEFKLSPFRHYELTAVVKNLRGKTRATYSTSISTFHTQDVIISSPHTNESVSVQCVFVSGSTADGCHVIFTDTSNGRNESFNITGSDNTSLILSTSGVYNVTVYDIVNGVIHGPAVELIKEIQVITTSSSPTPTNATDSSDDTEFPTITIIAAIVGCFLFILVVGLLVIVIIKEPRVFQFFRGTSKCSQSVMDYNLGPGVLVVITQSVQLYSAN